MLNENHALILDFPELKLDIVHLNHDNPHFRDQMQQYHQIDYNIRQLEISGSPIDDNSMHALKVERMTLKDMLYEQLMEHHNQ